MHAHRKQKLLAAHDMVSRLLPELVEDNTSKEEALVVRLEAEGRRQQQTSTTMLLSACSDEPTPVSIFRTWASRAQFRKWEKSGLLTLSRKNRKVCCVPSEFFAMWRELADKPRTVQPSQDPAAGDVE